MVGLGTNASIGDGFSEEHSVRVGKEEHIHISNPKMVTPTSCSAVHVGVRESVMTRSLDSLRVAQYKLLL